MSINVWGLSIAIVIAMFATSVMYKSYSDIQEAKQIQEHYEIVKNIKTLIAKQYGKRIEDITRDDIIAYLPSEGNWEKIFLLDRKTQSTLTNKELINEDANLIISENEKIKLLALKSKLENSLNQTAISNQNGIRTYKIGNNNEISNEEILNTRIEEFIQFMNISRLENSSITNAYWTNQFNNKTPKEYMTGKNDTEKIAKFKAKVSDRLKYSKEPLNLELYEHYKSIF